MRRVWASRAIPAVLLLVLTTAGAAGASAEAIEPAGYALPGPYAVEAREVTVERSEEAGGSFAARLFVPLPGEPGETPAISPVVAFGHGYLASVDRYESTLRHLASWGFTAIAPRSQGGLRPDHDAFASELSAAGAWVVDAAAQAGADWPGLPVADGPRGVSGHSMGGGAAVLAAARDPAIGAVATLAAADTRPSSIEAARALTAPTLYVAASDDAITPLDQHQRPMFEASGQVTAQLRIIEAASHCGFLDEAVLVGLVCDEAGIAGAYQLALAREALVAWLRLELMGDAAARDLAWPGEPQAGLEIVAHRGRV